MLQKDGDASKKDRIVLLLQDMLEVVTRDMMVNEIRLVHSAKFSSFLLFLVLTILRSYYPFVPSGGAS